MRSDYLRCFTMGDKTSYPKGGRFIATYRKETTDSGEAPSEPEHYLLGARTNIYRQGLENYPSTEASSGALGEALSLSPWNSKNSRD